MTIELKKLSPDDGRDIYNMLQELPAEENGFYNSCHGLSWDEYKEWLIKNDKHAQGIGLEDGWVPQTVYWLYVDGVPVGMGKLRHYLNEKLREEGGHCGYAVRPPRRNRGYGKLLLGLLIGEAKELGLDKILITVENHNTASLQVALSHGGVIEKVSDVRHYIWVDCGIRPFTLAPLPA